MRKTSKNRADDDVMSSTNGSMHNDDGETVAVKQDEKGDETNSGGGVGGGADEEGSGAEGQSGDNDRASDASFSGTPKKTKLKKKTKKRKSGKAKAAEEYEVEKIIEAKKIKGKLHYLIRWKGYGADNDTWEPEKTVSCPDLITKFKEEKENSRKNKAEVTKSEKKGKKRKSKDTDKSPAKKPKNDWDSENADKNEEYEVERVLEVHHKKDGSREFLIHWKGWSNKFDSWEPEDNLNCSDLIKKFMDKVDDARNTQSRSLRVAPESTNRFTLQDPSSGRRLSKRRGQRQRIRYDNAE